MKKETFFCDKCKKEVKANEFNTYRIGDVKHFDKQRIDLCVDCQEKVGIVEKKGPEAKKLPTTAEQLYDIIAEIVYENQGEG